MVASAETLESVKGKDLAVTFPAPSTSNAASTGGAVGYWKRHKQKKQLHDWCMEHIETLTQAQALLCQKAYE